MSKPAIPVVNSGDAVSDQAFAAIKQTLDQITGQQKNVPQLKPLTSTASLTDVITQLNAILARMQ